MAQGVVGRDRDTENKQHGSGDFHNRVRSIGEAPPAGSPSRYINAQTGSGDLTIEYAG